MHNTCCAEPGGSGGGGHDGGDSETDAEQWETIIEQPGGPCEWSVREERG